MSKAKEKNDKRAGESYACGLFFEYHFSVEFSGSPFPRSGRGQVHGDDQKRCFFVIDPFGP